MAIYRFVVHVLIFDCSLIEPIVVNGGILEVKSAFLSNGLVFTGTAEQDITQIPSIRIPEGLLNERSNGESMYMCMNVYL